MIDSFSFASILSRFNLTPTIIYVTWGLLEKWLETLLVTQVQKGWHFTFHLKQIDVFTHLLWYFPYSWKHNLCLLLWVSISNLQLRNMNWYPWPYRCVVSIVRFKQCWDVLFCFQFFEWCGKCQTGYKTTYTFGEETYPCTWAKYVVLFESGR